MGVGKGERRKKDDSEDWEGGGLGVFLGNTKKGQIRSREVR
jgi:hypothetical protein